MAVENKNNILSIGPNSDGMRLDNFLLKSLKGIPKTKIYSMIRKGEVRINSKRAKPMSRIKTDDLIRIPPNLVANKKSEKKPKKMDLSWIDETILHEEKGFLVVNKPSGLAVHGGSGVSFGLIELIRQHRDKKYETLELVHRIDKETSGILLIAKKRSSLRRLHQYFREGSVKKNYQALLLGKDHDPNFIIDQPIRIDRSNKQRKSIIDTKGLKAITKFKLLENMNHASLFEISPITGRTHQIRAHSAFINKPIAGDNKYGIKHDIVQEKFGLKRLFLHASEISFPGFETSQSNYKFRADLPEELKNIISNIKRSNQENSES
ncbi:MAG: RluA family pseudouridine synthase [Gammaproteobacteria bacterium]|nr:RluA family pseudouridine synthase [Gammaproteobacteria bacterium]